MRWHLISAVVVAVILTALLLLIFEMTLLLRNFGLAALMLQQQPVSAGNAVINSNIDKGHGGGSGSNSPGLPMVINTWGGVFTAATDAAYLSITHARKKSKTPALDAVEVGCATCEANQCDGTVGYGGSPDENCETTLDAMIMDGRTMKSGSVAALRRIKNAIGVARAVLEHTTHTMLAGDLATAFAEGNGFAAENLTTDASAAKCAAWRAGGCQPNYRLHVAPDPASSCGPYVPVPLDSHSYSYSQSYSNTNIPAAEGGEDVLDAVRPDPDAEKSKSQPPQRPVGHDTISMIALDGHGDMAAGTSTNGAGYKIPGRVGDGPITGSGSYVDADVGGCGATGDGDIMMRFLPCYQAVESLRRGMSPRDAAEDAVWRMLKKYPDVSSGVVVVNTKGEHAGAGSGWTFTYAYRGGHMNETAVVEVPPVNGHGGKEL